MPKVSQIAIVVHDHNIRNRLSKMFDPSVYRIIVPGQELAGLRFSGVIMTSGAWERMARYTAREAIERMERWYNDSLITRLLPDARVVHI